MGFQLEKQGRKGKHLRQKNVTGDQVEGAKKRGVETGWSTPLKRLVVAEKERFELSVEVSPHNRLAGGPFQPLMHFSASLFLAEEVGFEPTRL